MLAHRRLLQIISMIVVFTLLFSSVSLLSVSAQEGDGLERQANPQTGKVSFLGPQSGRTLSAAKALGTFLRPQDPSLELAKRFGPEFGLKNPERELSALKTTRSEDGRITTRYQQNHEGIPVMGGELIVNTNDSGDLYSMNGEVSSDISLSTQPTIALEQAREIALQSISKWYQKAPEDFLTSEPALWIYDESLLRPSTRPAELVWRMDVTPRDASMPVRELMLVNAHRGGISLHFNQVDTAWETTNGLALGDNGAAERSGDYSPALAFSPIVSTYTANNGTSLPGSLVCTQANPACAGGDAHAQAAHRYAIGTFNLYSTQHNRNSINGAGMKIISTVHYKTGYENAFWNGTQMVYGDKYGYPLADDVVAHELTHGVTEYESNLFYYYQSGAINESFSDIWGEYYDQTNGQGNDAAGVKWLMGEDVLGQGALRSLSDPPAFGDPDSMLSYLYDWSQEDNGAVHRNSGVGNKAAYLMVDGGSFSGFTVSPLGWVKTAAIYYEAQSKLLSSGADYADLYYALQQACKNLIGQKGIIGATCVEVKDALDAVEMTGQPGGIYNLDAPLCDGGITPNVIFKDDLEAGTANWTFGNGAYQRWQLDTPIGPYAQSGLHSLFADDYPDAVTDAIAKLKPLTIPANAYLHFAHAFGFDDWGGAFYDGGVLEYSINNGATWLDANSLIVNNWYGGQIESGYGNPLSGRYAFVGESHGYISTRLNLAPLAGKNVSFRWRMGLDNYDYDWGWWVDNIKLYTCPPPPGAFGKTAPLNGLYTHILTPTISWEESSGATSYQYCYDNTNNGACSNWISNGTARSKVLSGLAPNTIYYWQVRATNANGTTYADGGPTGFWSFHSLYPPGVFAKLSPVGGATNVSLSPTLTWEASFTATSYQYCYDTIDDNQCNRTWSSAPSTSVNIFNLGTNTTYYWQVRAVNAAGTTNADYSSWGSFTTTSTLPAGLTGIEAFVGTTKHGKYSLGAGQSVRESYSGVDNGPVKIMSTNNTPLISAERLIYKFNNTPTSFTEMMGLPNSQLDTTYWLPWYNNTGLDTQLRFANVSNATASVHVYIGGDEMEGSPFTLLAGESLKKSFPGIDDGPVQIVSYQDIVAAARLIYKVSGASTSFSEIMALPASQLDTTYWLPWYNNTGLDTQLRFANVTDQIASVHIYIGGEEMTGSPFTLQPGESTRKSFSGIDAGPVKIESDQDIVAAERLIYKANGQPTSFTEMMALPDKSLDTTYWLPWYNNIGLDTQLRFANVSDQTATVHIYIGDDEMDGSPFTLPVDGSMRISFPAIDAGPVRIESNVPIVAAERLIYKVDNIPASFSEMMALPNSQLDTTYWFPWYNNIGLDTQLRFGVP